MELRLQLHHHIADQKFVLIQEGDDWREEFNSMEEAMRKAATIVHGTVPLLVLDRTGNVVSEDQIHTVTFRQDGDSTRQ